MCDNHFFAVCVTTGHDVSKAQEFFDIVDEQFRVDDIPWKWSIAVSVGVDNTNSMIGRNNSSASWCRQRNPYIFLSGFPCHRAHIAAGNGHDAFAKVTGEKIEHLHKDLFYWFEKRYIARVFGVLWTRLCKNIKARVNKL